MEHLRRRAWLCLCLIAGVTSLAPAQGRSLYWRGIDVDARLDADGRLHVRERQTMVLTGDWNGGERIFRLEPGQRFEFARLLRVDPATGAERVLERGDLNVVDRWDLTDSRTLRWRSRRPADPPFLETELVYVLEYSYRNILVPSSGTYALSHDFLFTDRVGVVEAFTLTLELDGAWGKPPGFLGTYRAQNLPPGEGFVVSLPLRYALAGRPAGVEFGAGTLERVVLALLLVSGVVFGVRRFRQRERSLGRFNLLVPPGNIDESWLRNHVLAHRPEVVGAAWDATTGAPEVTAVLARLEAEGKLKSEVKDKGFLRSPVMHLRLLVPRGRLSGYERALIDALFGHDANETSTEEVRKRYQKSGFDPASKIRGPLKQIVSSLNREGEAPDKPSWRPTLLLIIAAVALLVIGMVSRPYDGLAAGMGGGALLFLYFVAMIGAVLFRSRVHDPGSHMLRVAIPMGIGLAGLLLLLLNAQRRTGFFALAGLTILYLAFARSVLNQAMSRDSAERIAFRKRLASAREYFRWQLQQPQPALRDEWFPYLIAFGLAKQMDRWFRAFGGEGATQATMIGAIGSSSSGSSSRGSNTWTGFGGGGGFSGGGASSSWAAAAGAMAAGVSAPSSSGSGGGGGGGGGGSSGGGGGGGW